MSMNKVLVFMLFFFLTSGSFTLAFNPVSASELIEDSWNTKTPMSQPRCSLGVVTVGDCLKTEFYQSIKKK